MTESALKTSLSKTEKRIARLLTKYSQMQATLKSLKEENEQLKNIINQQNQTINDFQYKTKISKIVESLAGGTDDVMELRTKIDEYIKELDNCIAYLNKQL